jgi:hypothetical protein
VDIAIRPLSVEDICPRRPIEMYTDISVSSTLVNLFIGGRQRRN